MVHPPEFWASTDNEFGYSEGGERSVPARGQQQPSGMPHEEAERDGME